METVENSSYQASKYFRPEPESVKAVHEFAEKVYVPDPGMKVNTGTVADRIKSDSSMPMLACVELKPRMRKFELMMLNEIMDAKHVYSLSDAIELCVCEYYQKKVMPKKEDLYEGRKPEVPKEKLKAPKAEQKEEPKKETTEEKYPDWL